MRTRAESETQEAIAPADTTRRDLAFASGAQFVSTDYRVADLSLSGYSVTFAGGAAFRCNPVNAPIGRSFVPERDEVLPAALERAPSREPLDASKPARASSPAGERPGIAGGPGGGGSGGLDTWNSPLNTWKPLAWPPVVDEVDLAGCGESLRRKRRPLRNRSTKAHRELVVDQGLKLRNLDLYVWRLRRRHADAGGGSHESEQYPECRPLLCDFTIWVDDFVLTGDSSGYTLGYLDVPAIDQYIDVDYVRAYQWGPPVPALAPAGTRRSGSGS